MEALDSAGAARLWSLRPRLELLFAHLAGPALRARVEIDDLVQETFLRALSDAGAWPAAEPNESALHRYLVVLARHVAIDAARAARARKRDAAPLRLDRSDWSRFGVHESALLARTAGPRTRAEGNESAAAVLSAFRSLSPEHRRVLGLRQFEGLSAAETAGRMNRSESAVHSLYRRALAEWDQRLR